MLNRVDLIGRVVHTPELKEVGDKKVCSFSVAVDRPYRSGAEKETDFFDCETWGRTAENTAAYVGRGSLVAIDGSIRIDKWEKDGVKRQKPKVVAERVVFLTPKNARETGNDRVDKGNDGVDPAYLTPGTDDGDLPF